MRILDRYITKSIVSVFLTTEVIFCLLYVLIETTSSLDEIIDRKVPLEILMQYYISYFPVIVTQTSSIACLIAVLLTYGSLHNHNEIIVMRASGMNFWQIARPAIAFGLLTAAFVFLVNEKFVPMAMQTSQKIENEHMILEVDRARKKKEKIKNLTFYGLRNRLYFVDSFNPEENEITGVTIIQHDQQQNLEKKIVAVRGVWTGINWKFFNVQITTFPEKGAYSKAKVRIYREKLMDIQESPADFLRQRLKVSMMNVRELRQYIQRFANSGALTALNNLKVDLYQKYAFPFGNFVVILVGLPFALTVRSRKGMTFTSLGIAILIAFFYYVTNAVSLALGKGGFFPPLMSAWLTPALFLGTGLFLIEHHFSK